MSILITHSCGHDDTHHLSGFASQIERRRQWLSRQVCKSCYRAAKERDAEQAATTALEGLTLPHLNGSERQIAWATKIRAARIVEARTLDADGPQPEAIATLLTVTEAKSWIDQRALSLEQLLATIAGTR